MPIPQCRAMILSLALVLAISALPAFAGPTLAAAQPAAASPGSQFSCAPGLDLLAVGTAAPLCQAPSPAALSTPWSLAGSRGGYCSCSCSLIPNCTTDADCGSGRCLKGVTCC
jgi:hypothetical protein